MGGTAFAQHITTKRDKQMKFIAIVKASAGSEAGTLPSEQELAEMGKYNEQLVGAGVMLAGEGLHPSSKGARINYDGDKRTVIDGPFSETKELVAGFWLLEVKSREEAVEWLKRAPFREGQVELRQVFSAEDFAASDPTGELRAAEDRLRETVAAQR